jgi:hypothetical protein
MEPSSGRAFKKVLYTTDNKNNANCTQYFLKAQLEDGSIETSRNM